MSGGIDAVCTMDRSVQASWWLLPLGIISFAAGAGVMLATNLSFHNQGRGTLIPWDAPKWVTHHYMHQLQCRRPGV